MHFVGVGLTMLAALAVALRFFPSLRSWWDGLRANPPHSTGEAELKATMNVEVTFSARVVVGTLAVAAVSVALYGVMAGGG
jgi:hypothetical protein